MGLGTQETDCKAYYPVTSVMGLGTQKTTQSQSPSHAKLHSNFPHLKVSNNMCFIHDSSNRHGEIILWGDYGVIDVV